MITKKILTPQGSTERETYSHGISVQIGDKKMIFVTGQIAAKDGVAIYPNDIVKQTEYVFESINSILAEDNASLNNVIKAVIYVKDINDFPIISKIRNRYFKKSKPVSTLVEISNTVRANCDIEIEVIAITNI